MNGSAGFAIITTSSNLTLNSTHHTVIINSGTPTISLPAAASSNSRRIYIIVNQTDTYSLLFTSNYKFFTTSNQYGGVQIAVLPFNPMVQIGIEYNN